ncbi:S-adenosyl-L-methionine-dependent methyltransferase [Ascodesmis nigricans]|uniref:S-adenosyl-L-methionine-dependent methyltransferase n=1 Tax=Ascodesmis nigricans TaxID=341454 RepID=A0A4S2N190_9PEZI|nr:S-adenosyl-L-methionine-dependent methyltransferase [Ascodesmis nigricans]
MSDESKITGGVITHHGNIEVDHAAEPLERDDGYGSGRESDTTSVSSSIRRHVKENGRTYHRYQEGKYLSPNDEVERDRLDFYHAVQLEMMDHKLFLAPLEKAPHRVLDCGTGTGIWALDMGDLFPSAVVTGIDLSPIQPDWVKFELDDLDQEWTFPENHFDFIHSRLISMGIKDFKRYFEQMYRHTVPGGWFEYSEVEFTFNSDDDTLKGSKLGQYLDLFSEAAGKAGLKLPTHEDAKQWAEDAGYVNVQVVKLKQPCGAWPKDKRLKRIGRMQAAHADPGAFESYGLALFTRHLGLSEEEAKKICYDASHEIQTTTRVHAYNWIWHIYGQKPETEAEAKET